ncbi:nuclear envelope protein Brr6 [Penicillium chermesinum]|uniref:Nuclear envelope protein Brr6 n=1 Tax=Penicillium chermesinum TaxID=63820 RepID=A0A9W9TE88_9EURO|nr:nuclear envelope protein Brr6 [Penicillium chermesinum]KAJ5219602.1 nuclear envelope protein Brr6 [Penicillium chermesinum]
MQQRTAESPMDFTWDNRPMDASSPFTHLHGLKQPSSFREPNNEPFFFSNVAQPRPPVFGQPGFTTPQKVDLDFSSGPPSPATDNDNDDTPEPPARADRRDSLFNMFSKATSSPGRGVPANRRPNTKKFSHKAGQRIEKRRNQHIIRTLGLDDPEEKNAPLDNMSPNASQIPPRSGVSGFLSYLEEHPALPTILSWWFQLLVNFVVVAGAFYILYLAISSIGDEFDLAANDMTAEILIEMKKCSDNYNDNGCHETAVSPVLKSYCEEWSRCLKRDPRKMARAKLSAQTMAGIINGFVDAISWKTIIVFLATVLVVLLGSNWSFRTFRNRQEERRYQQSNQQHYPPPSQIQNSGHYPYNSHYPPQTPENDRYYHPSDTRSLVQTQPEQRLIGDLPLSKYVTERSQERQNKGALSSSSDGWL